MNRAEKRAVEKIAALIKERYPNTPTMDTISLTLEIMQAFDEAYMERPGLGEMPRLDSGSTP